MCVQYNANELSIRRLKMPGTGEFCTVCALYTRDIATSTVLLLFAAACTCTF